MVDDWPNKDHWLVDPLRIVLSDAYDGFVIRDDAEDFRGDELTGGKTLAPTLP